MEKQKILLGLMTLNIGGAETHVVELAIGLKNAGYIPIVVSNGGVYVKVLEQMGILHYRVPLYNRNLINFIKSYFFLKKIIKDEKIDLVHAHARIPAFILGLLKKRLKFPFVTTAHWVFLNNFISRMLTNWGDATISVSDDISDYLTSVYNIQKENIYLTINGISTERFSNKLDTQKIENEFSIDKNKKHIVYISRLDTDRSLVAHHLLSVASDISKIRDDIDFIIVGGGNDFDNISNKAEEINKRLGKRLIIMTNSTTDVNLLISLSYFCIGVSRSILEAMASEKPVIVAGNEGYLGIFTKDKFENARLSNFTCRNEKMPDEISLKNDILKMLSMSEQELFDISKFNKEIIENYYSVEKMTNDAISVYKLFI